MNNELAEGEIRKLHSILTSTNLWARAKAVVLKKFKVDVTGSSRPVENLALDLAIEKGAMDFISELEDLLVPKVEMQPSIRPTQLTKRKTTSTETE